MRHIRLYVLVAFLILPVFYGFGQTQKNDPIRKTIFIIVDGISDDVIQEVKTHNLEAIAKEGAFLPAYVGGGAGTYSETPTISAVGYNSLLTGTWANKHNVWGNGIENPNYHYWTIFRQFKEQYPSKEIAVFSTWLDNRTKLIGTGLDATGQLRMNYHFDGFEHDTMRFPHDEATTYIRDIDDLVADEAAQTIRTKAPDMSWVYLQFTDNMGHQYGDHPKFYKSIRHMDYQVGLIWKAVKEREEKHNEEWLIIITTDHGRSEDGGKDHGGQSERERSTWLVTNSNTVNEYGQHHKVGIVDIMPSIAGFMNISIPQYRAMELDGIPFLGNADAVELQGEKSGDHINLSWTPLVDKGQARIWLTTTNKFQYGGEDRYYYIGDADIKDGKAKLEVGAIPSSFYKVVLETPHHFLNTWIVE